MSTIGSTAGTTGTTSTTTTAPKTPGTLDKDGFLKMLVGQMKNQDPMNPQGGMDIGQMAQFSMVEQITNLVGTTQQLLDQSRTASTLGLVGRTVTYTNDQNVSVTGTVDHVTVAGGIPKLTVDGIPGIDPANISEVA